MRILREENSDLQMNVSDYAWYLICKSLRIKYFRSVSIATHFTNIIKGCVVTRSTIFGILSIWQNQYSVAQKSTHHVTKLYMTLFSFILPFPEDVSASYLQSNFLCLQDKFTMVQNVGTISCADGQTAHNTSSPHSTLCQG